MWLRLDKYLESFQGSEAHRSELGALKKIWAGRVRDAVQVWGAVTASSRAKAALGTRLHD